MAHKDCPHIRRFIDLFKREDAERGATAAEQETGAHHKGIDGPLIRPSIGGRCPSLSQPYPRTRSQPRTCACRQAPAAAPHPA
jgi:hypothetical protein